MSVQFRSLVALIFFCLCGHAMAIIHQFSESFDGNGEFDSLSGNISGLDNPGWNVWDNSTWELMNGGLRGALFDFDDVKHSLVQRQYLAEGSFTEEISLTDFTNVEEIGSAFLNFQHDFGESVFTLNFSEDGLQPRITARMGGDVIEMTEFQYGSNIEIRLEFDSESSEVQASIRNNDADTELSLGPFRVEGMRSDTHISTTSMNAKGLSVIAATIDNWSVLDANLPTGDFNNDGRLDVTDVDLLIRLIRQGGRRDEFDLVKDGIIDDADLVAWVHDFANTFFGDSDLDGEFNSSDLVSVFQANEYEDELDLNSTWATGDWNGDGDFTSRDLVFAFGDGGYEVGQRVAAVHVPEPSSLAVLSTAILMFFSIRRGKS